MRTWSLTFVSFFLVLGAGWVLLAGLGGGGGDPRAAAVDSAIDAGRASVLILGNSVTQSAMDADALGSALTLPKGGVARLATEGAGPATWLASWDRAWRAGLRPRVVVLYVPLHMLWTPEAPKESDLALLADLDAPAAAWVIAGHDRPDFTVTLQSRRYHLRERFLEAASAGLVDLLWKPSPSGHTASSRARAALFPDTHPNEHAAQGQRLEGGGDASVASAPKPEVVDTLAAFAVETGARLVVVQPAANPEGHPRVCGPVVDLPELEARLVAAHVDLLDLETLLDQPRQFTTHHHLTAEGRSLATAAVAEGVAALDSVDRTGDSPGRRWGPPCP